jgi:DNA-binding transcriptional MocR family regulator
VDIVSRAREEGILLPIGDPFFAERPTGQYLRLAFSYVTPQKIEQGVEALGQLLTSSLQTSP